jgi:hypothetical protein
MKRYCATLILYLELSQIDIERAIEAQRCGDGAHNLGDQSVQVRVTRTIDGQVAATDVVDGLVVDHEGAVGMFERCVGCQNRIVRLHDCRRYLKTTNICLFISLRTISLICERSRRREMNSIFPSILRKVGK